MAVRRRSRDARGPQQDGRPVRLSYLVADVPDDLGDVIDKCWQGGYDQASGSPQTCERPPTSWRERRSPTHARPGAGVCWQAVWSER